MSIRRAFSMSLASAVVCVWVAPDTTALQALPKEEEERCTTIIPGPWLPFPPPFADEAALCNAFAGFPAPPSLQPPVGQFPSGEEAYLVNDLAPFIRDREYVQLGWFRDNNWRLTGPYAGCPPDGSNFGVHGVVRIFYSPEIVEWMCMGRPPGGIPDGAMIVKEQHSFEVLGVDGQGLLWVPDAPCPEPSNWAVMIKASGGSHDGWYWAGIGTAGFGNPPIIGPFGVTAPDFFSDLQLLVDHDPSRYPTGNAVVGSGLCGVTTGPVTKEGSVAYPYYGFGNACINCHASAAVESTFASLDNILGAEKRYPYLGDGVFAGGSHTDGPHPNPCDHPYPNPLTQPDPAFAALFDQLGPFQLSDVLPDAIPAQTYDHVLATPGQNQEMYLTSDQCISCHDATQNRAATPNMIFCEPDGDCVPGEAQDEINLSPYAEWSASPMGLAGRDPIFYAQLETERNLWQGSPLDECIQTICFHCHGVMGQRQLQLDAPAGSVPPCGTTPQLLPPSIDDESFKMAVPFTRGLVDAWAGFGAPAAKYGALARDGISCTVCHREAGATLGDPSTFTGTFSTGLANELFGPFADNVKEAPMQHALGVTPKFGAQTVTSEVCGTCHAIKLPVLDQSGANVLAYGFEQTTYLEWQNSVYAQTSVECQECHMPNTYKGHPLSYKIANIEDSTYPNTTFRLPDAEIDLQHRPYRRHTLYGLNVFLNEMFQQFPLILGVRQTDYMNGCATPALQTGRESVLQIAAETALVDVFPPSWDGNKLTTTVQVVNLAGHKFPSGVGFRRAFLEFQVLDGAGNPIWASGRTDSTGVILEGPTSITLPTEFFLDDPTCPTSTFCQTTQTPQCYQPHRTVITSEDQVQIYEELVANELGCLTDSFLARFDTLKDNRILPIGWDPNGVWVPETAPEGAAIIDPDYTDVALIGTDTIIYEATIPPGQVNDVAEVRAALYYQAIPPHYLNARFDSAAAGPHSKDTKRLHYLTSHMDVSVTADDGDTFIESWKLEIANDLERTPPPN